MAASGLNQPLRQRPALRRKATSVEIVTAKLLEQPHPEASFKSTVIGLLKNMLGSSFLAMPDAFKIGSLIPSLIAFLTVSLVSIVTMSAIAVLCAKYDAHSYRELWDRAVGPRSAPLVDVAILLNSLFSCISYSLLTGSWLSNALGSLLGHHFAHFRVNTLVVTVLVFFPLVMLRDLHALRHVSLAGIFFNVFGVCFIVWQAVIHWSDHLPSRACGNIQSSGCSSSEVLQGGLWRPSWQLIVTVNMCASMTMAHYNVPKFHSEYGGSIGSFTKAVEVAVALAFTFASLLSIAGVLRFGTDFPNGNILEHFDTKTMDANESTLTTMTWLIMALNIIASFPLLFSPLRVSLLQLMGISMKEVTPMTYLVTTVSVLAFTTICGLIVPSLTVVIELKGAICGMCICYIFPATLLWYTMSNASMWKRIGTSGMFALGWFLLIYGVCGVF